VDRHDVLGNIANTVAAGLTETNGIQEGL
jgi:hypothetical protein